MNNQEPNRFSYDEIVEMLPAFVVGALDPDEMLAVEDFIDGNPELLARVHALEDAAAKLAYAAPAQPLPKSLQAKVMDRARASLPPRSQPASAPPVSAPRPERPIQPPMPATQREPRRGIGAWWRSRGLFDIGLVATIAAALLLAVLFRQALLEVNQLRTEVQGLEQQVATLQTENSLLQVQNLQLQRDLEAQQNQMASLANPQQVVPLGGTEAAPNANGTVYVRDGIATLVLSNLDTLSDDQIYQLWLIPPEGAGAPIPAGLLGQAGGDVDTITLPLPIS
jgi:anti-sigma-K factor RskA